MGSTLTQHTFFRSQFAGWAEAQQQIHQRRSGVGSYPWSRHRHVQLGADTDADHLVCVSVQHLNRFGTETDGSSTLHGRRTNCSAGDCHGDVQSQIKFQILVQILITFFWKSANKIRIYACFLPTVMWILAAGSNKLNSRWSWCSHHHLTHTEQEHTITEYNLKTSSPTIKMENMMEICSLWQH